MAIAASLSKREREVRRAVPTQLDRALACDVSACRAEIPSCTADDRKLPLALGRSGRDARADNRAVGEHERVQLEAAGFMVGDLARRAQAVVGREEVTDFPSRRRTVDNLAALQHANALRRQLATFHIPGREAPALSVEHESRAGFRGSRRIALGCERCLACGRDGGRRTQQGDPLLEYLSTMCRHSFTSVACDGWGERRRYGDTVRPCGQAFK